MKNTPVTVLPLQLVQDEEWAEHGAQRHGPEVDGMWNADRAGSKNLRLVENQRGEKQNWHPGYLIST